MLARNRFLGTIVTKEFDNFLIIGLSKKWIHFNDNRPLQFEVTLTKEGQLVLSASIGGLSDKTKDVDNNAM